MATTTVIVQTPFKDKAIAWFLVSLHYMTIFILPAIATYYYLAEDVMEEAGKGGIFYFLVMGVLIAGAAMTIIRLINKQKANLLKSGFRVTLKILLIMSLIYFANYININIESLMKVLRVVFFSFIIGSVFEFLAVLFYRDYIREVGVF